MAGPYSQSIPKATDEQSALSRILHNTATDIIDISTIENTPGIEQQDYVERAAQVERILASEPISHTDLAVITEIAMRMDRAVKEMEVENTEELVVPFGVN